MDRVILRLLRRTIPKLLENPDLVRAHNTTVEEVEDVRKSKKIPVQILENIGGDHFFLMYGGEFGLSERKGEVLDFYLQRKAKKEFEELRKLFPYVEKCAHASCVAPGLSLKGQNTHIPTPQRLRTALLKEHDGPK